MAESEGKCLFHEEENKPNDFNKQAGKQVNNVDTHVPIVDTFGGFNPDKDGGASGRPPRGLRSALQLKVVEWRPIAGQ